MKHLSRRTFQVHKMFKIIPWIIFYLVLLFPYSAVNTFQVPRGVRTAVTVGQKSFSVVQFALKINSLINSKENQPEVIETLKALEERIASSTTTVLNLILLQSKLERVEDTVIAIHSSLIDVRKILSASTNTTYQTYVSDFIRFYEQHETIKHIRFLPELLTYRIPGVGSELLSEITKKTRCNMTALGEFTDFYLKLVSDGIALQTLYYSFTTSLSPQTVFEDEWPGALEKIQQTFDGMEQTCFDQFSTFARGDVTRANNLDGLALALRQRYLSRWSDVMFYASTGTEQFHYMKYNSDRLFRHDNGNNNKVAVFGLREEPVPWNATDIERKLKNVQFRNPSEGDETAAKVVTGDIEKYINYLGHSIGVMLVFFDGQDFEATGVRTDTESPVVTYEMDSVTLEYCFDSGVRCTLREVGKKEKKTTGKFRVYIYPQQAADRDDDYETDGATTHAKPLSLVLAFILCFIFSCSRFTMQAFL